MTIKHFLRLCDLCFIVKNTQDLDLFCSNTIMETNSEMVLCFDSLFRDLDLEAVATKETEESKQVSVKSLCACTLLQRM